jgi:uncharacterized protein
MSRFRSLVSCRVLALMLAFCFWNTFANAQTPYLAGKFVWAEFVTDDLATARNFYGGLLGWTFQEADGYVTAFNGDQPVAGLLYHARPKDGAARPRWICYLSASNLSQVTKSVQAAGGVVRVPAMKIPGLGERVIFADPEGAMFGLMHLQAGDPEDYLADNGSWIWLQLLSRDINSAAGFYQKVGGYSLFKDPQGSRGEQDLLVRDGYARAAVTLISPKRQQEGVTPVWLPFLHVEHVAESLKQVSVLGGQVLLPPDPGLFDGRVAVIADPSGGVVGLMEWDAEQEAGGDTP